MQLWHARLLASMQPNQDRITSLEDPVLLGHIYFLYKVTKIDSATKLTAKDAAGTKTVANATSSLPECNGRCPGQGFGKESVTEKFNCSLLARANLGRLSY